MVQRHSNTVVRQEQIVNAARKVIIKNGSEHLTVRRIAKEVGISEAAIYRHFKGKREILSFLADYIEVSLLGDIDSGPSSNGFTKLESLDKALRKHLSAAEQKRGIAFQIIAEITSFGDKKLNKKMSDIIDRYIGSLRDYLIEGVKAGEVRADADPEAAAMILFGTVQSLVLHWYLSNYSFDPEEKYEHFWKIFRSTLSKN